MAWYQPVQHEVTDLEWVPAFYDDLLDWFPDEKVEVLRDRRCAVKHIAAGDLSFFTKELPALHNAALASLERGEAPPKVSHLGWLLRRVWESPDSCSAAWALGAHRQICHALYKLEVPYEEDTLWSSYQKYRSTEEDLSHWVRVIEDSEGTPLGSSLARAHGLLSEVIAQRYLSNSLRTQELRDNLGVTPSHGPGSVATGEQGDDKWRFKRKYHRLHSRFPYYDWFICRGSDSLVDALPWYHSLEGCDESQSKLVAVPKDSRGPRLISEEPLEIQYIQHGYLRFMTRWRHRHLDGHVFFDQQERHRELSLQSSKDRRYATLDLKDASDRVSRALVKALFPEPIFRDLDAMRSTTTILPDGSVVPLNKMSPMGSSVCFPTMAYVLWALCAVAFEYYSNACFGSDVQEYPIYIFGDDIIVPVDTVPWVKATLQSVGLIVNEGKSYAKSYFRESCGMDAYYGVDITPIRVRRLSSRRVTSVEAYLAMLSYINSMSDNGWHRTATALQRKLERDLGRKLPRTLDSGKYPGVEVERYEDLNVPLRWSKRYSCMMALAEIPIGVTKNVHLSGSERLLRNLTMGPGERPDVATLRRQVKMRRQWVRVS